MRYWFVLFLFTIYFVFSCGPQEEQFADGIKYLGGSNKKAEAQFESSGLNARDIAKYRLMKDLLQLKDGIEKKRPFILVSLSNSRITRSLQRAYKLSSEYKTNQAWVRSFENGKAWCDYDLLFKDKIVSYEIEPLQADQDKEWQTMRYVVYLRKEGQTGKLTFENSHVLVFKSECYIANGECGRFPIYAFTNHCPILSPEEGQYLKDL
ncbi:hypothetical protein CH373_15420 [Leptospira perolatii]|uniref:Lipoprotein n=1 Tax=Leptospira perolatii TaxID=2023191 RepID=A0A2M9ZJS1_9LEPT|nr:hypothetical protein [Leptospira perolatii]PJZ69480.1 hypothetical protein CH360_10760 [Leptospira perolatii]PJZ72305.1 hypothetical protein CH373_15420 [Leptospira perolatii]